MFPIDTWREIVTEALQKGLLLSTGAVPGAKLREQIAKAAKKYGLEYPPLELPNEKFGDFLKRFDSAVIVWRREGQDFLVAPADKPELLAEVQATRPARLRDDIFEAFTRIPRETPPVCPWYDRSTDTILWAIEADPTPTFLVRIPPNSQAEEIEDRRLFAELPEVADHRNRLLSTLGDHHAMWAFSNVVRELGLGRKWHLHRFQSVVRKIKKWCLEQEVVWHDDWIGQAPLQMRPAKLPLSADTSKATRKSIERFTELLSEGDLQRISVPLDIVLKLVNP